MWQYALWGLAGAAINRAMLYLEAAQRIKGWPWRYPYGPGGGPYLVATTLHLGIGAIVAAGAADAGYVSNALIATGIGAAAPIVVNRIAGYTLALLPRSPEDKGQGGADA